MPLSPQEGHKPPHKADTGLHGLGVQFGQSVEGMAERKLAENPCPALTCRNLFEKITFAGRLHSDYSAANFSQGLPPESNFLGHSHFLREGLSFVAMRLVYLFPPQILGRSPSPNPGEGLLRQMVGGNDLIKHFLFSAAQILNISDLLKWGDVILNS